MTLKYFLVGRDGSVGKDTVTRLDLCLTPRIHVMEGENQCSLLRLFFASPATHTRIKNKDCESDAKSFDKNSENQYRYTGCQQLGVFEGSLYLTLNKQNAVTGRKCRLRFVGLKILG